MANPEHVEVVKKGRTAIAEWRKKHPDQRLDLSGADLTTEDLSGAFLASANLTDANLRGANLSEANLTEASLTRANLHTANLTMANLTKANLSEVNLSEVNLTNANLTNANLASATLTKATLTNANLTSANLTYADLTGANLTMANLRGANLSGVNLRDVHGAPRAEELDSTTISNPTLSFETAELSRFDALLDWEHFRAIGRLPLFSVSYAALILIPVFFYVLDVYNRKVELARVWAAEVTRSSEGLVDIPQLKLAEAVSDRLHALPIPNQSLLLISSTILLAAGATLYTFFCPSRIKEFSRDQWCDQLKRDLVHYWPFSWKFRPARLLCATCYLLGGLGALWVIATKIARVAAFVWKNAEVSLI